MSKHTPGPWKATEGSITYCQWNIQTVDLSHKKTYIGEVGGGYHTNAEVEANAKLIAAAPDLLDACMQLIYSFDNNDAEELENGKASARDAINKALNQ